MRTIRASEIGTYLFCQRAWWFRIQGYSTENEKELAAGTTIHLQHTRLVWISGCIRAIAYILLITAIILIAIYLTRELI
jgi:CRISPR/Cas system-associated exonuclease Cas4 (RecB family)